MSETHKSLLAGVEKADSITWNPHKMMGIPLQTSVLLTKDKGALNRTNNLNAEYLFHAHENSAYDLGDKTLQCGRKSDALKFWLSWQFYGKEGYAARIDHAFDMAAHFTALVNQSDNFELVQDPVSLNVCFWYKDSTGKTRPDLTAKVYDHVQQNNGSMLVNFNPLSDHDLQPFFRIIMNSPKISETSCQEILDDIVEAAQVLEAAEQQQ
jgi:glutamate/tyrosine decarboxylase-like PLP-dependent enzyme